MGLSPDYYEDCADDIISLYSKLEDAIVSDIVRRIMKTGQITGSAEWQIKKLQEAGLLYEDILQIIAGMTDSTEAHVKALFEDAGVETVEIDNESYRKVGKVPVDIRQSPAMRQILEAGYKKTLGNMKNLTLTTAITSQNTYINACNSAYMKAISGAFSYQEAIRQAVQEVAQHGATVIYPSGHTDRIDIAIRRAVLTGVGQTTKQVAVTNAKENDWDLMEINAHSGARPSHAKWQGKVVSLSGQKGYLSLRDIGYGTGEGFGGWNCRHDWYPFIEGDIPMYSKKKLDQFDKKSIEYNGQKYTEYEISQIQRRYEREIRAAKREQTAYKAAVEKSSGELKEVMQTALTHSNDVVKDKQAKMREFIRQTGQQRDYFREQNYATKNILTSKEEKSIIIKGKVDVFLEKLNNGEINLKIKKDKQKQHIRGSKEWKKRIQADIANEDTPTSAFYEKTDIQSLMDKYSGTGIIHFNDTKQLYPVEYVTADSYIGKVWNFGVKKFIDTKRFAIRYSKKGVHLHPVKEGN